MATRSSRLRLIIDSSDARKAARDLDKFGDEADRAGRETDQLKRKTDGAGQAMRGLGGAVRGLVAALAIREVLQFADSFQQAQNRIRLVTDSTEELISVQERLQEISQRTFSTFGATTEVFQRFAQNTRELGVSQERLLGITETINKAVAISGVSAESARAALVQLGQGIAANAFRGQELNSVLEQTPALARAIAEGLGVELGELRKLGEQGSLTAESVLGALENQADEVDEAFKNIVPTIGQVGTVISQAFGNALVEEFTSELGDAGEATLKLTETFEALGTVFGKVFALGIQQATRFVNLLEDRGLIGGDPISLRFEVEGVTFQNRDLQRLLLDQNQVVKIAAELDASSLAEIEQRFNQVSERIAELQLIDSSNVRSLGVEGIAELSSLQTESRNLFEIIAASAEATDGFRVSTEEADSTIQSLGKSAGAAAEQLEKAFKQRDQQTVESLAGRARDIAPDNFIRQREILQESLEAFAEQIAEGNDDREFSDVLRGLEELAEPLVTEQLDALEKQSQANQSVIESNERLPDAVGSAVSTSMQRSLAFALDGIIFGGGSFENVFGDIARDAVNDNIFDPLSKALTGDGGVFSNITDALRKQTDGLTEAFGNVAGGLASSAFAGFQGFELGKGVSGLVGIEGNASSQQFGGAVGGLAGFAGGVGIGLAGGATLGAALGSVVPVVGTIIGAALGAVLGGLLSNPSDLTAQGVFNPLTGDIAGRDQDGPDASGNAEARDAIIASIADLSTIIASLTGAQNFNDPSTPENEAFINVAVRRGKIEVGFQGANGEPVGGGVFEPTEEGATQAINEGLRVFISSLSGGEEALVTYAKAASEAGREAQSIVSGLETLSAVFALNEEPISQIQQQLRQLDSIIDPVIADLESLGLSIAEIQNIARDAAREIGKAFIETIEDDILQFRNATLGQFKRILEAQELLLSDATALLERGAITPAEFDLVQVRNALERESFFENLSADELESLGDFFGLIEDSGGSVAVVLTQLTAAFVEFTDNVAETRDRLQEEADQLQGFADQIFRTRDQIDLRFPSLSGGELLGDLRGQLNNLREAALAGDNTAFEQIPDLADRFVNLARELFGGTTDFAEERDFALGVLDQTGSLAESRANKLLSEIEALNTQVDVLNEIRDALESPDPAIEFLQAQLDQGEVQNDLIRQLLIQYIALTQEARAGALTPAEAQAASEGFLSAGGTPASSVVSIDRFDESIVLLSQIRAELAASRQQTTALLSSINTEQRRSTTNATLTG